MLCMTEINFNNAKSSKAWKQNTIVLFFPVCITTSLSFENAICQLRPKFADNNKDRPNPESRAKDTRVLGGTKSPCFNALLCFSWGATKPFFKIMQ